MASRIALIAGATGLVGGHCVRQLVASDDYQDVVAIGRRPVALEHEKLRQVVVDFDALESEPAMPATDVFCCLGTTLRQAGSKDAFRRVDFEYPVQLARVALRDGASHFLLVSSLGANRASRSFYLRVKGDVEDALRELGFARLSIFRPSLLLGSRSEVRIGERIGAVAFRALRPLLSGPLRKYRPVEADGVARAMIAVARAPGPEYRVVEAAEIATLGRA